MAGDVSGAIAVTRIALSALVVAHAAFASTVACAQGGEPRLSQRGSVTQQVAGTRIEVEYFRPVARGRDLFPGVVRWGRIWTPGADSATTISVSTDVKINGETLPAGKYSIWTEPKPDSWTVIFNKRQPVFHMRYPYGEDVLRVRATPRTGEYVETLAFYFPVVDGHHAELVLQWGTMVVPLEIDAP